MSKKLKSDIDLGKLRVEVSKKTKGSASMNMVVVTHRPSGAKGTGTDKSLEKAYRQAFMDLFQGKDSKKYYDHELNFLVKVDFKRWAGDVSSFTEPSDGTKYMESSKGKRISFIDILEEPN